MKAETKVNRFLIQHSVIILIILIVSLIVIFFIGLSSSINRYSNNTKMSALVNPKYLPQIKLIQIIDDNNNQEIILQKNSDNKWHFIDRKNNTTFMADNEYINNLLKDFTLIISLYEFVDTKRLFNSNNSILFYTSSDIFNNKILNSSLVSYLSFGNEDISNTLISVYNNKNSYFYVKNNIYEYLNFNPQKFIIKDFFPVKEIYNNPIHQVIIKTPNSSLSLFSNTDPDFETKIQKLILLRSNEIDFDLSTSKQDLSNYFQLSITLVSGTLSTYEIELYKIENQYFIKANNIYYRISQWSVDLLYEIFN